MFWSDEVYGKASEQKELVVIDGANAGARRSRSSSSQP
jgi:hypothetical protein